LRKKHLLERTGVGEMVIWKWTRYKDGERDQLGSRVIQKYLVKISVPRHLLFRLF